MAILLKTVHLESNRTTDLEESCSVCGYGGSLCTRCTGAQWTTYTLPESMDDTIVKEAQHIYFKGRHNGLSVISYTNHPACCLQGCDIETRSFPESQSASFITLGFQERKIVPPDVAYVARNRNDALLKTIVKTLRLTYKKMSRVS